MNTPNKQTVYLPVRDKTKIDDETEYIAAEYHNGAYVEGIERKEGYFFTPEQLNEYTANVIKQALETAAEKAITDYDSAYNVVVDKKSITTAFEETFQKYKV